MAIASICYVDVLIYLWVQVPFFPFCFIYIIIISFTFKLIKYLLMVYRLTPNLIGRNYASSINFFEVCRWMLFYAFLEFSIPFFLDPLQLTEKFFDISVHDWFEFCYFAIIPNFVLLISHETSPFASTYGLILYLFLTSMPFNLIYQLFLQDLLVFLIMMSVVIEFFAIDFGELSYYED